MAPDNFPACVEFTLSQEGGFVDNPLDPGGATNYGITLRTLSAWLKIPCAVQDVKNLKQAVAVQIYRANYWLPGLPAGVDLMVFDESVNAGPGRSVELLQGALGFQTASGWLDANTRAWSHVAPAANLIKSLGAAQAAFYKKLPKFAEFGDGWLARLERRQTAALAMLA
jgi:lysozyme family protein